MSNGFLNDYFGKTYAVSCVIPKALKFLIKVDWIIQDYRKIAYGGLLQAFKTLRVLTA